MLNSKRQMPAQADSQPAARQRPVISRPISEATAAQTLPRRRIHGGGIDAPMRYPVTIETTTDDASSTAPRIRSSNWRATLVGALVGLLIVMLLLMKWLMEYQVTAAAERRIQESAIRTAAARCFELKSHGATDACLKGLETRSNSAD